MWGVLIEDSKNSRHKKNTTLNTSLPDHEALDLPLFVHSCSVLFSRVLSDCKEQKLATCFNRIKWQRDRLQSYKHDQGNSNGTCPVGRDSCIQQIQTGSTQREFRFTIHIVTGPSEFTVKGSSTNAPSTIHPIHGRRRHILQY